MMTSVSETERLLFFYTQSDFVLFCARSFCEAITG